MDIVENSVQKVYERWVKAIKPVVGNNYSMDMSKVPSTFPYMRLSYLGGTFNAGDLEGNECAVTISYQVESFATGQKKLNQVYEIDDISHQAMTNMGFRRGYHGTVENISENILRVVSRYSRVYSGNLLGE